MQTNHFGLAEYRRLGAIEDLLKDRRNLVDIPVDRLNALRDEYARLYHIWFSLPPEQRSAIQKAFRSSGG